MNIIHVCDSFLPNFDGVIVSMLGFSEHQVQKGHKVMILAPKYSKKNTTLKKIKVVRFNSLPIPSYEDYRIVLPNIKQLTDTIKNFNPDIIHIHTLPGLLSISSIVIAKRSKIPVVATYHTSFPDILVYISPNKLLKIENLVETLNNKLEGNEQINRLISNFELGIKKLKIKLKKPIKKANKRRDKFSRKAVWMLTKQIYSPVDLIIAPSNKIKKELDKYKLKVENKVISNGLDLKMFKKKSRYNKFPKFLHVGRLDFAKKIQYVIQAMELLIKKYPDASLTLVGDGPAKEELENLVKELKLDNHITFLGFVNREKLPPIYRRHDVFLTASEMETQGIVLIEALASGLPVIGARVLAIPEVVHNNKTGYLVPKRNPVKMAERMIEFIENPKLIKEYGKNARKEAEKHDINNVVDMLEKTYEELI